MIEEASGVETKAVQNVSDEVKTNVDEVVRKVIKWRQSYDIAFYIWVIISYEKMKQYWYSKGLN